MTRPISRVAALVLAPRRTWAMIANEPQTLGALFFGYVAPLAAIGPIATYLALRVVGISVTTREIYRASQHVALVSAAQTFGYELGGVFLIAALIALLAPAFGASRDLGRAFAVAAYAYTPLWLAGVLVLVPRIAALQLVAAGDALALLVLGLIASIGAPPRRALVFAAVVVTAAFGCGYLIGVAGALVRGPIAYVAEANSR